MRPRPLHVGLQWRWLPSLELAILHTHPHASANLLTVCSGEVALRAPFPDCLNGREPRSQPPPQVCLRCPHCILKSSRWHCGDVCVQREPHVNQAFWDATWFSSIDWGTHQITLWNPPGGIAETSACQPGDWEGEVEAGLSLRTLASNERIWVSIASHGFSR